MSKKVEMTGMSQLLDLTKMEGMTQMSQKIRYLHSLQIPRADIAKILNIRYQWVRNVLITPVKKVSQ